VILLNPEKVSDYLTLYDQMPDAVKDAIREHHFRDYSVYVTLVADDKSPDQYYVVRYYEYAGVSHQADVAGLERNADYRRWQEACEACEVPLAVPKDNQWWTPMEEVFHQP